MARILLALLVLPCAAFSYAQPAQGLCAQLAAELPDFVHCIELHPTYALAWKTDNQSIWYATDAKTAGWAGFGLSEAGGMKGADLTVLLPAEGGNGGLKVLDTWSSKFGIPEPDDKQDAVLVWPVAADSPAAGTTAAAGMQLAPQPGRIRAIVRRPLQSCDPQDIAITPYLPQHLVWARGDAWPVYHGADEDDRGDEVVTFIAKPGQPVQQLPTALEPGAMQLDVVMPNISLPTAPTSYLCTHFELPHDRKYHITARQALVRSPLVHHMILFACNGPRPNVGKVFDCLRMETECTTFGVGWAPGQDYFEFPADVGYAFGSTPPGGLPVPTWFALQVHYNNPEGATITTPDNSGMRLTYTPNLRPNDIGVLTLTQMQLELAPKRANIVAAPTLCPAECTQKMVTQPVTMLYTLLHMHQTGKTIITRHIRGNMELPPLGSRSVWDFNHQEAAPIPLESRQLLPGDALVTRCTYDTSTRVNFTRWGEGTMDEMCFDFVMYYPRLRALEYCATSPTAPGWNTSQLVPAICGDVATISKARGNDTKPDEAQQKVMMERMSAAGVLVQGTWPSGYRTYKDPRCRAGQPSTALLPRVQAASSASSP